MAVIKIATKIDLKTVGIGALILVICLQVFGVVDFTNLGSSLPGSTSACAPELQFDVSLSGTNGYLNVEQDTIVLTDDTTLSDFNFTITTDRVDGCTDSDGDELTTLIVYECSAVDYNNKDDSSDTVKYHTTTYDETYKYNITVGSVDWATKYKAVDRPTQLASTETTIVFDFNNATELDKITSEDYINTLVGKCDIKYNDKIVKSISLMYVQD